MSEPAPLLELSAVDHGIPLCYVSFVYVVSQFDAQAARRAIRDLVLLPEGAFHALSGQLKRDYASGVMSVVPREHPWTTEELVTVADEPREMPVDPAVRDVSALQDLPNDHPCLPKNVLAPLWPMMESAGILASPLVHINVVPLHYVGLDETVYALGIQAHHNVLDGRAFFDFVRVFADTVRAGTLPPSSTVRLERIPALGRIEPLAQSSDTLLPPPPPVLSNTVVMTVPVAPSPPSPLDPLLPAQRVSAVKQHTPPMSSVRVHFRQKQIDAWRQKIVEKGLERPGERADVEGSATAVDDAKLSANAIVCAVLWRAVQASLPAPAADAGTPPPSRIAIPVDLRNILGAYFPGEDCVYYGNGAVVVAASGEMGDDGSGAAADDDGDEGHVLRTAARRVAAATRGVDLQSAVECVKWIKQCTELKQFAITPFMTGPIGIGRRDVGVTNWSKMPVSSVDFGSPLLAAMPDAATAMSGVAVLLPAKGGDGLVAHVGVLEASRAVFLADTRIAEALAL